MASMIHAEENRGVSMTEADQQTYHVLQVTKPTRCDVVIFLYLFNSANTLNAYLSIEHQQLIVHCNTVTEFSDILY